MDILPLCAEVPFKAGDIIKQTYQLQQQLGTGAYGVIFSALYTNGATTKHVAIKIEKNLPQFTLQANEVFIMKAMENCKHFAKFYQCGTHEDYKFVAMELLGPSLIQLANRHHPCRLNLHDLIKFGIQAVESLKELHKAGFVHRDVKPDNFVIGNQQNTTGFIYLIDFGLFKKINKENGVIVKPLQPSSFRGTLRYASPNAHKRIELGRSDDIISLFYLMIELFIGKLPWSSDIVLQQKLIYRGGVLIKQMPKEFQHFEDYIFSLDYTDEPDYELIVKLFKSIALNEGIDLSQPFDWENEINEQRYIVIQKQFEILKQRRKDQKMNKNNQLQIEAQSSEEVEELKQSQLSQLINNQNEFSSDEYEDMYYQRSNISLVKCIKEKNLVIYIQMKKDQYKLNKQAKQQQKQQKNNEKDKQNQLKIKEDSSNQNQKNERLNLENINKLIKNDFHKENQQNNEKELIREKEQQEVKPINNNNDDDNFLIQKQQFKRSNRKVTSKHYHQQQTLLEKDSQIMKDLNPHSEKSSQIQNSDNNKLLLQHSQSQASSSSQQQTQSQYSSAQQQSSFLQQSLQISTSLTPLMQQTQNKSDNCQYSEADFGEKSKQNISISKSPIFSDFTSLKPATPALQFCMNLPQCTQLSQDQELSQQNSKNLFQSVQNLQNLIKKQDQTQIDMELDNRDFSNNQFNTKPIMLILSDCNNALMSQCNTHVLDAMSLQDQNESLHYQNQSDRSQMIDQDQQDETYPEPDVSQNASHNLAQLLNIQSNGLSPNYQQSPQYQESPHNNNNSPSKYNFAPYFPPKLFNSQSAQQSPKFSPHNQLHSQRFTFGKNKQPYSQMSPSAKSQSQYQQQRNLLHLHQNQQFILQQRMQQFYLQKAQAQQQLQQQQQYQKQSESYLSSQIGKIKQQSQQMSDQSEQSVKLENTLYSASFKSYNEKNTNTQTSHQQFASDQFNAKESFPMQQIPSFASLHHQNQNVPPDLCSPSSSDQSHQLKQQNPAMHNSSESASVRSQDQMSYDSQMYPMSPDVSELYNNIQSKTPQVSEQYNNLKSNPPQISEYYNNNKLMSPKDIEYYNQQNHSQKNDMNNRFNLQFNQNLALSPTDKISNLKDKYNQQQQSPNEQKLGLSPEITSSSSSSSSQTSSKRHQSDYIQTSQHHQKLPQHLASPLIQSSPNLTAIQKIFSENSNKDQYKQQENLKKFNQHSIEIQKSDECAGFYQNLIPASISQTCVSQSNQYTQKFSNTNNQYKHKKSLKNITTKTSHKNQNYNKRNSSAPSSPHSDYHTHSNIHSHSSENSHMSNNADANIIFGFYPQYSEICSSKSENFVDLIIVQNQQEENFLNNQFDEQRNQSAHNNFDQQKSLKMHHSSTYNNQSASEIHYKTSDLSNWKQFIDSVGANYVLEEQISNIEGNTLKQMKSNYQESEIDQTQENKKDDSRQAENQTENQKMKEFEKEEIKKEQQNSNNEEEMNMKNKQIMQQFDENITNEKEDDPKQNIELNNTQQQTLNQDQNKQNQDNNNEQQQQINLIQLAEKFYQVPESEISKNTQLKSGLLVDDLLDEKIKNINEYDTNNDKEHEEMNLINNNNKIRYDDNKSQQNQTQKKKKKIQGLKRQNKQQQLKFNEDYTKINITENTISSQYLNMENKEELIEKDNQEDSFQDEDILLPNQVMNNSIKKLQKIQQQSLPQSTQYSQYSQQTTSLSSQSTPQKSDYFNNLIDNNSNKNNKFKFPNIENIHSQISLLFQTPTNSHHLSFSLNSYQPDNSNFISTELSTSVLSASTNSPPFNRLPSNSPPQISNKSCSPPTNFQASPSQLNHFQASPSQLNHFQASPSQLNHFQASPSQLSHFQTSTSQLSHFQTSTSQLNNFQASPSQLNHFQTSTSQLNNFQASTSQLNNFQASTSELSNSTLDQLDNSSQDYLNPLYTLLLYNQPLSYSQNNQQINHTGSTYSSSIQSKDNLSKTSDQPDSLINSNTLQSQPQTKKKILNSKFSNSQPRKNVINSSSNFSQNSLSSISSLQSQQPESKLNNQEQEEQNEKLRQKEVQGNENINNGIVQKQQQQNAWSDDKEMKGKTQLSETLTENLQESEISKIKEKTDVNINSSFNTNQNCCIIL